MLDEIGKKNRSGIKVSVPNVHKGDKVITFEDGSDEGKKLMAKELREIRKGGSLLSLMRGKELMQIFGYDPKKHAWIMDPKVKSAERLPVEEDDEIHVVVPQSGG